MSNLRDVMEGMAILRPYYDDQDADHLGAEHDEIFMWATDRPVSPEDVLRLRELGWRQPDVEDDDEGEPGEYDPEESWAVFV